MMDPREAVQSGSGPLRPRPYDRVVRLRLRLGIIVFTFGVVAIVLLVTTGEATPSSMLVAAIDIILGLTAAISGWRDLREVLRSRGGQPPV